MNWFFAILQLLLGWLPAKAAFTRAAVCPVPARRDAVAHDSSRPCRIYESPISGWLTLVAVQSLGARPPSGRLLASFRTFQRAALRRSLRARTPTS